MADRKKRLRDQKGETLVETLAAILIVSLSSALFLAATVSAARINSRSLESDRAFQQELAAAEQGGDSWSQEGAVTIQINGKTHSYDVNYSGDPNGDPGKLIAYRKKVAGP